MNDIQKQRLEQLKSTTSDSLAESEKSELAMLETIEKMSKQIDEKDSMIGKRDTELDNLKKDLAKYSDGKEKDSLEARIKEKEEALDIAKAGLQALKDAQKINFENANKFPKQTPEHGGNVDPTDIARLEKAARTNEQASKAVTLAVNNMTDEEYDKYDESSPWYDPEFKLTILKMAVPDGEKRARSPWGKESEPKGAPPKSAEERLKELFGQQVRNGRSLPPGMSGNPGRPGLVGAGNVPPPRERPIDTSTF